MYPKSIVGACLCGVLLLSVLPSCNEFLETEPRDRYQTGSFYNSQEAAEMAVTTVYSTLSEGDLYLREIDSFCNMLEEDGNLFTSELSMDIYTKLWKGIADANIALEAIPPIDFDEQYKNQLLAQVRFLRAFYYHSLSKFLGPLPLILEPMKLEEIYAVKRVENVDVVRDFIIEELLKAEPDLLPKSKTPKGRVTSGAAAYLLANVYMYRENWVEAEKWLKKIIDSEEYRLLDKYEDICSYDTRNEVTTAWEYSDESLLEVGYVEGQPGYYSEYPDRLTPSDCSGNDYRVSQRLMELPFYERVLLIRESEVDKPVLQDSAWFNQKNGEWVQSGSGTIAKIPVYIEDPRRSSIILRWGDQMICVTRPEYYVNFDKIWFKDGNVKFHKRKYWPTSPARFGGQRGMNYIIWRYADVLLDYAEVQYRLGNINASYQYMNLVRERAWREQDGAEWKRFPDKVLFEDGNWHRIVYPILASQGLDKTFIDLIHEYFIEFAYEGRLLDLLMRWRNRDVIAAAFGYASSEIYPDRPWFEYPQDDISKNPNLNQNPGF